jgi:predicted tellurium resistance membrane protein TerC
MYDLIVAFVSLSVMLIILDIDNVIFMSILTTNLSESDRKKVKRLGLFIGLGIKTVLFLGVGYLTTLNKYHLDVPFVEHHLNIQNIITLAGGLFLMYKCTKEIHEKLEGDAPGEETAAANVSSALYNIAVINAVFSLDSVITAVGMVKAGPYAMPIMLGSMLVSMVLMFIFQGTISHFVYKHPTLKVLALAFLLLIGLLLVVEGVHVEQLEIPKGYIYFAMAFSLFVEVLNINISRKKKAPVQLRGPLEKASTVQDEI